MLARRPLLVLLASLHAAPVAAQVVETVDLRVGRPTVLPLNGDLRFAGAARTDAKPEMPPLEVSLRWLDRDTYRYFDSFTYRVRVTNIGAVPLSVPRRRDVPFGPGKGPQVSGHLELFAKLSGAEHLVHSIVLRGMVTDPGETRLLQPGESVEFIAAGRWKCATPAEEHNLLQELPAETAMMARLHLRWPEAPSTLPVLSNNSLPVALLPYQTSSRAKPLKTASQ